MGKVKSSSLSKPNNIPYMSDEDLKKLNISPILYEQWVNLMHDFRNNLTHYFPRCKSKATEFVINDWNLTIKFMNNSYLWIELTKSGQDMMGMKFAGGYEMTVQLVVTYIKNVK